MTTTGARPPHACPRCRGRLFTSHDRYGVYSACLSCGYVHDWLGGPAIDLPDDVPADGRSRRRQPSYGKLPL